MDDSIWCPLQVPGTRAFEPFACCCHPSGCMSRKLGAGICTSISIWDVIPFLRVPQLPCLEVWGVKVMFEFMSLPRLSPRKGAHSTLRILLKEGVPTMVVMA